MKSLHFFQGEKKENEQLLDVFEKEAQSDAKQKRSSLKVDNFCRANVMYTDRRKLIGSREAPIV